MDDTIILYLVKAGISISLFYGVYMLCLRTDTFLKLRRFYFLFAIVFSISFPIFNIELPLGNETAAQMPTFWLSEIDLGQTQTENNTATTGIWTAIIIVLFSVSFVYLFRFITQLYCIIKLRIDNEWEQQSSYRIVKISGRKMPPFSFFKWIFIDTENISSDKYDEIIAHEQVHAQQLHSIDTILSEILCIFFWWNPFVWLIRKEIKINLEYLADQGVLQAGYDSKEYQYILLEVSSKHSLKHSIINNFNISQLKKRIMMMNKKDSYALVSFKYLLIIPLGVILLLGNAVQATSDLIDISSKELLSNNETTESKFTIGSKDKEEPIINKKPSNNQIVINKPRQTNIKIIKEEKPTESKPFVSVDEMPEYPEGVNALMEYIRNNLKYPENAQKQGIQGRVTLRFVVAADGQITNAKIIRGIDPECDAEAIRVVENMPKWIPGKQNGHQVPVYFNLPIQFRLKS